MFKKLKNILTSRVATLILALSVFSSVGVGYFFVTSFSHITKKASQVDVLSDGSTLTVLDLGPRDVTGLLDDRKNPKDPSTWVARQRGNSCGLLHALGRAAMCKRYLAGEISVFGGELEGRKSLTEKALAISLRNERTSVQQEGLLLETMLGMFAENGSETAKRLCASLRSLAEDATVSDVKKSTFYEQELESCDIREENDSILLQNHVDGIIRNHKKRVDAFQRGCWRLLEEELEQGAFDGFELAHFSRLVTTFCKHIKNIIYQIQPLAGEWNTAPHNRWVMRQMIVEADEFKVLRASDNATARSVELVQNFSLVSKPKTWAQQLKTANGETEVKKIVSADPDLKQLFANAARYRAEPIKNPQIFVLATFKDEDEEKYNSWGHWVTILVKYNEQAQKNEVTYMESSHWWGADEMGETAQGQRENLEALMYLLNEAPVPAGV